MSNPITPDLRASYAVIHGDSRGTDVELRRVVVVQDAEALTRAIRASHFFPDQRWLLRHWDGSRR